MKKCFILLVAFMSFLIINVTVHGYDTEVYVYTPKGTPVFALTDREHLQEDDINYYYEDIKERYPNAVNISYATRDYNCHSYAWHSQDYMSNFYWIPDPAPYITDGSYVEVTTPVKGDVIAYYNDEGIFHSGIVDSINSGPSNNVCGTADLVNVKSKWSYQGLYLHRGDECEYVDPEAFPSDYATYVKYYRLAVHVHSYSCVYYDYISHKTMCLCGDVISTGSHIVNYSDAYDGDGHATCLECLTLLDLSSDVVSIIRSVPTEDFILPSGIVVLVNSTLEEYLERNS